MTKEARIGIIGLGNIGQRYANELLANPIPRTQLTAVCTRTESKLEPYARKATVFTDRAKMLAADVADAVIIATPHFDHPGAAIEAFEHGVHVLVDKPIAVCVKDARRMLEAQAKSNLIGGIIFNQRVAPAFIMARKLIQSGVVGNLVRLTWIATDWFRTNAYYRDTWKGTWRGEGGGILLNQCPHQLDLLQWLVGMPVKVRGFCRFGACHTMETEDEVSAFFEFPNGAMGSYIASSGEAPGTNRLEIAGDKGRLLIENNQSLQIDKLGRTLPRFIEEADDGFAAPESKTQRKRFKNNGDQHRTIIQNFMDAILDDKPLIAPLGDGLNSLELANSIMYSNLKNRIVDIPMDDHEYSGMLEMLIRGEKEG